MLRATPIAISPPPSTASNFYIIYRKSLPGPNPPRISVLPMESSANLDPNTFESLTTLPQQEDELDYNDLFGSLFPDIEAELFTTLQLLHEEPFIPPESSVDALQPSELTSTMESIQDPQNQNIATSVPVPAESNDILFNPVFNSFSGIEQSELSASDLFHDLEALLFGTGGRITTMASSRITEIHEDIPTLQAGQTSATHVSICAIHIFLLK